MQNIEISVEPDIQSIESMLKTGQTAYIPNFPMLYRYLGIQTEDTHFNRPKIKLYCNWCSSSELANTWSKMYIPGKFRILTDEREIPDYYIVINATQEPIPKNKTILFRMEPNMDKNNWGEWSNPDEKEFLKVFRHQKGCLNVLEWHLSKTYTQLRTGNIEKSRELSTVLSCKYSDPGQVKRIDFVKFLQKKGVNIDVYGDNKWDWKNYKGGLPYHKKDEAIFPYKYTFNVENNSIANYCTEKLIDGILGECLTFYSGCYNIKEYIDDRAYVYLDLIDFEKDLEVVTRAIKEDWHTQRLPYIRAEKKRILEELQFFPMLEKVINGIKK